MVRLLIVMFSVSTTLAASPLLAQPLPMLEGGLKCVPEKAIGISVELDDLDSMKAGEYETSPEFEIIISPWDSYPLASLRYDLEDVVNVDLEALSEREIHQLWKKHFRKTENVENDIVHRQSEENAHLGRLASYVPQKYSAAGQFGCNEDSYKIGDTYFHHLRCGKGSEVIFVDLQTMQYRWRDSGEIWAGFDGVALQTYGYCYSYNP